MYTFGIVVLFLVGLALLAERRSSSDADIDDVANGETILPTLDSTELPSPDPIILGPIEMKRTLESEPSTYSLMFDALSKIGCQPTKIDNDSLSVSYQGEDFRMDFGGRYASIWDLGWASINVNDPDTPKMCEVVNNVNYSFGPTVVMTLPNEDGVIGFHSRRDIMLHPSCPDNAIYVQAVLDSFFAKKEQICSGFRQIHAEQKSQNDKRRPIGYTSNNIE